MEIRALRGSDDRSAFRSGDESLDRFLRMYAGQNQFRHHLGVTYVAVEGARLLGYATVAPRHVDIEDLPERDRRRLPHYPIPVLGLARLAVDEGARGAGLGAQLLRYVLLLSLELSERIGCAGVVVDAKEGAVSFYERFGFTRFDVLEGDSATRPRPATMWLPIDLVKRARGPRR